MGTMWEVRAAERGRGMGFVGVDRSVFGDLTYGTMLGPAGGISVSSGLFCVDGQECATFPYRSREEGFCRLHGCVASAAFYRNQSLAPRPLR